MNKNEKAMTQWQAHAQCNELFSGCEVDFVESPQVPGNPPLQPDVKDTICWVWPDERRESATVLSVDEDVVTVEMNEKKFSIRRPNEDELTNPIRSELRGDPWIVCDLPTQKSEQ